MFDSTTFITFIIVCLLLYLAYWYLSVPKNLPPGPVGLPLFGCSFHYLDAASQVRRLNENVKLYGPLFKFYIFDKLVVVLGDYETIQEALVKQGDVFAGRPQNKLLTPARFYNRGRPVLEPRIKEEAEYLCERMGAHSKTGRPRIFRSRYDDEVLAKHFVTLTARVSGAGISMISPFMLSEIFGHVFILIPKVRAMAKDSADFIEFVDNETREVITSYDNDSTEAPTNYIHAYMKTYSLSKEEAKMDNQLMAAVLDLFVAGTETSTTTLRWSLLILAHNPSVQTKLYDEIKAQSSGTSDYAARANLPYTEATITELQRLSNLTALGAARRTLAPTTLRGYHIPQGAVVVPFLENVMHNPDLFPEPLRLDPNRFLDARGKFIRDPRVIPFQAGKRICPGEGLARMELFIFLTTLISHFRFFFPEHSPSPTLDPVIGFTRSPRPFEICIEARGGNSSKP